MDCELIFYTARKTSFCQRSLSKCFSHLDLNLSDSSFATNARTLGPQIIKAFDDCNIVFVVGGLGCDDKNSIKYIMSNCLSHTGFDSCKKLENKNGDDGFVIQSGRQILVLLPDEPQQIEEIMQGPVSIYIQTACRQ